MGDTFKLAMQLTMIDMLSGVARQAENRIKQLGVAGKEVARDFELMERHATRGLKAIAVANYTIKKMRPGVAAAADLQESMIDVHMSLMRSGKSAAMLGKELAQVRATAIDLQKITPFSAVDVVRQQKELMNSGLEIKDVIGNGAARAAMMLATITKEAPESASAAMLNIGIPYHLQGGQYGEVADVIQKHVMSGRMKLTDLNAGLPYVAPVAKNFKVPWDDLLTGMAVLGEQGQLGSMAGTHLKDFYGRLTGASRISRRVMSAVNRDLVGKGKSPLEFWDKKGEMKPTQELIKSLRTSMESYNTKQRMFILEKIFGEQGGLAAMALMSKGTGSWEFVKAKVLEVASAEDKMTERLKGFTATVTALGGTTKTTLATIFDPMLEPMSFVLKELNEIVAKFGELNESHPAVAKATSSGLAGVAGVAGGYGLYQLIKAGKYGGKVLKGLRGTGLASLGVGIAEGKAVEAVTGVKPVFVTNWPVGFGTAGTVAEAVGTASGAGGAAAGAGGAVAGAGGRAVLGRLLMSPAGLVGLAATGGVLVGTGFNMALNWQASQLTGGKSNTYGEMIYDKLHSDTKNEIKLEVSIDSQGKVSTRSNNMDTSISTVKRGAFFNPVTGQAN